MMFVQLAQVLLYTVLTLGNPVTWEYSGQTDPSGQAFIDIAAQQALEDVTLRVRGGGQNLEKELGDLPAGATYRLTWTQKTPHARYEAEVSAANIEANFVFEVVRPGGAEGKLGKLKFLSSPQDIRDRQQATYQTPFPTEGYKYTIYDSDGEVAAADTVERPIAAGERFTIKWPAGIEVFLIEVEVADEFGRTALDKRVPWSVEIPHTEINFDSGKSDVKTDESAKLDEAVAVAMHELAAIDKANKAVGESLQPRLYIVGYTDTVGPAGSNQKLSQQRAKAIAEYFRDAGFWAPIFYAGMGERGLRVQTPDSTDEVRNRRALYLIGMQDPAPGGPIPGRWAQLVGARTRPPGDLPPLPERWANYREERTRGKGAGHGAAEPASDGPDFSDELPSGGSSEIDPGREPTAEDLDLDYGDGGGPPAVEGEPGATQKGCRIGGAPSLASGWLLVLAAALRRRRARARR